jgi:hypothetical protein
MTINKLSLITTIATVIAAGAAVAALYGADATTTSQTLQGSDDNQAGAGGVAQTGTGHIAIVGSPGASVAIATPSTASSPHLREATPLMDTLDMGAITGPEGENHVVCREVAGTPIAIREEKVAFGVAFVLIEIHGGPHNGKIGWVSSERIVRQ